MLWIGRITPLRSMNRIAVSPDKSCSSASHSGYSLRLPSGFSKEDEFLRARCAFTPTTRGAIRVIANIRDIRVSNCSLRPDGRGAPSSNKSRSSARFARIRMTFHPHFKSVFEIGSVRMRFPVAIAIALHRAGTTGGSAGSPNPVGGLSVILKCTSIGGA